MLWQDAGRRLCGRVGELRAVCGGGGVCEGCSAWGDRGLPSGRCGIQKRALRNPEAEDLYFEYIYFARPDAVIDGVGVYASRIKAGRFLAMDSPVEADMVVGVPESGNPAAQGYAMESGIPYGTASLKILMLEERLSSQSRACVRAVYR